MSNKYNVKEFIGRVQGWLTVLSSAPKVDTNTRITVRCIGGKEKCMDVYDMNLSSFVTQHVMSCQECSRRGLGRESVNRVVDLKVFKKVERQPWGCGKGRFSYL